MRKYTYNLDALYKENAISYYLLGAFYTDGCVYAHDKSRKTFRVSIASKDYDWLVSIKNLICPQLKILENKNNLFELRFYSQEMAAWLVSKGCTPHKSLTLQMPEVPSKYLPDFIRGCIDGDGCISVSNYTKKDRKGVYQKVVCYLCSSSPEFIKSLDKIIEFKHSFVTVKPTATSKIQSKNPHYRIFFNDRYAKAFLNWIYYPNHSLSLFRKYRLAIQTFSSLVAKTI